MGNFFSRLFPASAEAIKEIQKGKPFEFIELDQGSKTDEIDSPKTDSNNPLFSVLSYNILADAYSGHFRTEIEEKYLNFAYRSPIIIEELKALNADIVCLQEVDNYEEYYKKELKNLGYKSLFGAKTSAAPDGCVIGIKKDVFAIMDKDKIEFDKGHPYENAVIFKRGNIALVTKLMHRQSGQIINLICTHFYWDPRHEQVKYLQMNQLLKYVNSRYNENDVVIWAGDLNLRPFSNTLQYVLNGSAPSKENLEFPNEYMMKNMTQMFEDLEKLEKKVKFQNAYQSYNKEGTSPYPKYTNYTLRFKDTIDHILYSPTNLNLKKLLKIPTENMINTPWIPNHRFPSDHLPIMAVFELLQKAKKIV